MTRKSFGIDVLGTLVVEIEASDGTVGFGVTTAGEIGAFIVEKHLARFVEGKAVDQIETIWDQMYGATLFYGRKGLVLNAISGVDLALWDLLAKVRGEPVHALLGGAGARRARLLRHRRAARPGEADGLHRRQDAAGARPGRGRGRPARQPRAAGGDAREGRPRLLADVRLLDEPRPRLRDPARRRCREHGLKWLEECLPPDDYWGYADAAARAAARHAGHDRRARGDPLGLSDAARDGLRRHPAARRRLVRRPDRDGQDLGDGRRQGVLVVPHGSSVYSYHFVVDPAQQPVRRVPDDGARRRQGGADVHAAAARRAGARGRAAEGRARSTPRASACG